MTLSFASVQSLEKRNLSIQSKKLITLPEDLVFLKNRNQCSRRKGGITIVPSVSMESCGEYCTYSPEIDNELRKLHETYVNGDLRVLVDINRYLLVNPILERRSKSKSWLLSVPDTSFILSKRDSYTYENLPDLTTHLRRGMIYEDWHVNPCCMYIHRSLPFLKRIRRTVDVENCDIIHVDNVIRVLHGLLLALYPTSQKIPPFWTRSELAYRLRELLSGPSQNRRLFVQKYENLCKLATAEYMVYLMQSVAIIEYKFFDNFINMTDHCRICSSVCAGFRQQSILNGKEDWEFYEQSATKCVDRLTRLCRFKTPRMQHDGIFNFGERVHGKTDLRKFLSMQVLMDAPTQSSAHNPGRRISAHVVSVYSKSALQLAMNSYSTPNSLSHMRILNQHEDSANIHLAYHIQKNVQTFLLPRNIYREQHRKLRAIGERCKLTADAMQRYFVCLYCATFNSRKKSGLRMRGHGSEYECITCGCENSVAVVNMFGKLLKINTSYFFLSVTDLALKEWHALGCEFSSMPHVDVESDVSMELAMNKIPISRSVSTLKTFIEDYIVPSTGTVRVRDVAQRCIVCSSKNVRSEKGCVFVELGCMYTIYLCGRHSSYENLVTYLSDLGVVLQTIFGYHYSVK